MINSQRIVLMALLLVTVLLAACRPGAVEPSFAPEIFITPGPPETILISTEDIPQNNCDGGAEMSQTVERSYTVSREVDLGTEITVDAGGRANFGVGEVGVGAAVAAHYNVSYGSQETVTRSVTVAAERGENILHTVRQNMIWETGTLAIAGVTDPIPYRFRKDFGMETLPPANLGCPGQVVQPPQPTAEAGAGAAEPQPQPGPAQTEVVDTQPPATPDPTPIPPTPTQTIVSTTFEVYANLSWQDTGVVVNSGDTVRIIWDGNSRWRGINVGDFSDPLGGYSDPNANYSCTPLMPSGEAGWNAMVAKVGGSGTVTNPFKTPPVGEGTLYLAMNDCDEQRYDNEGSAIVTIEVRRWQ